MVKPANNPIMQLLETQRKHVEELVQAALSNGLLTKNSRQQRRIEASLDDKGKVTFTSTRSRYIIEPRDSAYRLHGNDLFQIKCILRPRSIAWESTEYRRGKRHGAHFARHLNGDYEVTLYKAGTYHSETGPSRVFLDADGTIIGVNYHINGVPFSQLPDDALTAIEFIKEVCQRFGAMKRKYEKFASKFLDQRDIETLKLTCSAGAELIA